MGEIFFHTNDTKIIIGGKIFLDHMPVTKDRKTFNRLVFKMVFSQNCLFLFMAHLRSTFLLWF